MTAAEGGRGLQRTRGTRPTPHIRWLPRRSPAPNRSRASFRFRKIANGDRCRPAPAGVKARHHPGAAAPGSAAALPPPRSRNEEVARRTRLGGTRAGAWAGLPGGARLPPSHRQGDRAERDAPPSACPLKLCLESRFPLAPSERERGRDLVRPPLQPCCSPALPCNPASFSLLFASGRSSSNFLRRNDFQLMKWVGPPCTLSKITLLILGGPPHGSKPLTGRRRRSEHGRRPPAAGRWPDLSCAASAPAGLAGASTAVYAADLTGTAGHDLLI
jgi:hypothetical protein